MTVLRSNSEIADARRGAAQYEARLQPGRRKRLGQFFSGLPLGRLLAAIALDDAASTVVDPMAGHGDLLDAVIECGERRGQSLSRVDGVEIDAATADMCRRRLEGSRRLISDRLAIRDGNAFDVDCAADYAKEGYDLVITNPPYVRYQALANSGATDSIPTADDIRRALRIL